MIDTLRDGLHDLTSTVQRGIDVDLLAARVRRERHRRRLLGTSVVAVLVLAGGTGFVVNPFAGKGSHVSAVTDQPGPTQVTLPPDEVHPTSPFQEAFADGTGTQLSRFPIGDDALILVGAHSPDGYACTLGYLESGARGPGTGGFCTRRNNPSAPAEDDGSVIYLGIGESNEPDNHSIAYSGSAPPGSVTVTLTAHDGSTVTESVYDAGPDWGHRAYFAMPFVGGTVVVTSFDAQGNQTGCGTTAKPNHC